MTDHKEPCRPSGSWRAELRQPGTNAPVPQKPNLGTQGARVAPLRQCSRPRRFD